MAFAQKRFDGFRKADYIGVVAFEVGPAVAETGDADDIDRPYRPCVVAELIQQGDDVLLVWNGHIQPPQIRR